MHMKSYTRTNFFILKGSVELKLCSVASEHHGYSPGSILFQSYHSGLSFLKKLSLSLLRVITINSSAFSCFDIGRLFPLWFFQEPVQVFSPKSSP